MHSLAVASDHAGLGLKSLLSAEACALGWQAKDLGPYDDASVDYPDYADKLAAWLKRYPEGKGVLICGSGIGISIAANRHRHVRAALCTSPEMAKLARQHNDANVLCLGARLTDEETARECLKIFLNTEFEGGRHGVRVEKLG